MPMPLFINTDNFDLPVSVQTLHKHSQMSIIWWYNLVVFLFLSFLVSLELIIALLFCLLSFPCIYSCINSLPKVSARVVKLPSIGSDIPGHLFWFSLGSPQGHFSLHLYNFPSPLSCIRTLFPRTYIFYLICSFYFLFIYLFFGSTAQLVGS